MPLSTTLQKAKEEGVPCRDYRPEKGESWVDVMDRAKQFFDEIVKSYVFGKPAEVPKIIKEPEGVEEVKELAVSIKKKVVISAPKMILKKEVKKTVPKTYPKVLAVTHGGFIMEFMNVYRTMKGVGISDKNMAKNTAIFVIQAECAACKDKCKGTCGAKKALGLKMLVSNDNTHILKK